MDRLTIRSKRNRKIGMKQKLENQIKITKSLYNKSLSNFISSNTRKDRDRFLMFKHKLDAYLEIMEML